MGHIRGNKKRFFYSVLCFILSVLILNTSFTYQTFALSDLLKTIFKENNLMFWNPDENPCKTGFSGVDAEAFLEDKGENAQTIFSYLTQNGYSNTAAAAIMGNLKAESGAFNPRQLQKIDANSKYPGYLAPENFRAYDNGKTFSGGFGIAQWTYYTRVRDLQAFADSKNLPVTSLSVQVRFLRKELLDRGITPNFLNSMGVRSATEYILKNYERPADQSSSVVDTRTSNAESFLNYTSSEVNFDDEDYTTANGLLCVTEEALDDEYQNKYENLSPEELLALLENGGLSASEASRLLEEYKSVTPDQYSYYNINPNVRNGTNSPLYNCVAFVRWYVKKFYNYNLTKGDGVDVVSNILGNKPAHSVPKAGAVISYPTSTSSAGHTAVILGIDGDNVTIGEASYYYGYVKTRTVKAKDITGGKYTYAYPEDMGA